MYSSNNFIYSSDDIELATIRTIAAEGEEDKTIPNEFDK